MKRDSYFSAARDSIAKRIKRLSLMPIPISGYVDIVFDLVSEAITNSEVKVMILNQLGTKFIWKNIDFSKYAPLYNLCFDMTFEESGLLSHTAVNLLNKTVLTFEEVTHPNFNNSYVCNELYKPVNIYYLLLTILRNGEGKCVGQFPLFRPKSMQNFTKEDALFMESIAPYIAYGISKSSSEDKDFAFASPQDSKISFTKLQEGETGLILADKKGEIVSLNDTAKNIFFQMGLLDDLKKESMGKKGVPELISYINCITKNIFSGGCPKNTFPLNIYTSPSGISIMMKGYFMEEVCPGAGLVAITCEKVLRDDFIRLKKRIRYNLSEKEFEICRLMKEGYRQSEISEILHITRNTLKTHTSNILSKLDLGGTKELTIFTRGM